MRHQKEKSFHIKVPHMMRSPTTQAIRGRDARAEKMRELQTIHAELLRLRKPEEELPGAAEASSPE